MRPGEILTAPAMKTLGKWPDHPAPAFVNRAHAGAAQHSRGAVIGAIGSWNWYFLSRNLTAVLCVVNFAGKVT